MASCNILSWGRYKLDTDRAAAKIPQPKEEAEEDNPFAPKPKQEKQEEHDGLRRDENGVLMPQTLVRIPVLPQK